MVTEKTKGSFEQVGLKCCGRCIVRHRGRRSVNDFFMNTSVGKEF